MFGGSKKAAGIMAVILSLCFIIPCVFTTVLAEDAPTFDQLAAGNGSGFVPLADNEKTDFVLFGSHAKNADGMQGRWKMLTREQVESVTNNATAKAVFGDFGYSIWSSNQSFSTYDGSSLILDQGISGINLKMLAEGYGIESNINTKTQLTAIDRNGEKARTTSHAFEKTHYYFSDLEAAGKAVNPLLKVSDGQFSLRVGQEKATQTTSHQWKNDIKALQIDTVTTATAKPDVVFDVNDENRAEAEEYVLSDIVDAGQYKALFAYYNAEKVPMIAEVEGVLLKDVLAERGITVTTKDLIQAVDDQGNKTTLKGGLGKYFLAYKGTVQAEGAEAQPLTSTSEFCLFGPGTTESAVRLSNLYSVAITRAPKATKVTGLTKKGRAVIVSWKKTAKIKGYQISMSTKKSGTKVIKTITKASTVKFTKKSLKKGKRYYFKVRTYKMMNGKKVYSSWSAAKYKKI